MPRIEEYRRCRRKEFVERKKEEAMKNKTEDEDCGEVWPFMEEEKADG